MARQQKARTVKPIKKKANPFRGVENVVIDYKDTALLRKF
ncbi:30S ribosomal protein S18, partial [Actinotignum timonense]|nr:30S ribosomal protein S18 [Actinotignum timonense]